MNDIMLDKIVKPKYLAVIILKDIKLNKTVQNTNVWSNNINTRIQIWNFFNYKLKMIQILQK